MSNIDSILVSQQAEPVAQPVEQPVTPEAIPKVETPVEKPEVAAQEVEYETTQAKEPEAKAPESVDEYGTEVPPPRTYTEEEVQRMIRERLQRGNQGQQQATQQQVQQAAQDFTPDPASSDNWETQLEGFVEKTIVKLNQTQQRTNWEAKERETQAKFEENFNTGMVKYADFKEVVAGKPITDAMMMATRDMSNPAAFIYAASKMQPKELERIAQIQDPYIQAREIGKLDERMRKRPAVSNASKPATKVKGDMPDRSHTSNSIDFLIQQDAKRKYKR